jgi:hypothetical protein
MPIVALVQEDVARQIADMTTERLALMSRVEVEALRSAFAANGWTADAYVAGKLISTALPTSTDKGTEQ